MFRCETDKLEVKILEIITQKATYLPLMAKIYR